MKKGRAYASVYPSWIWMIPLMLLVTLMAGQGINADPIWYDELTSIGHAGGLTGPYSPLDIANSVIEHSPKHTPFFFTLLAGWATLLGWHHAVLRCLPLFFGLLAIAWTYRIGRDFLDARAGFWACAFPGPECLLAGIPARNPHVFLASLFDRGAGLALSLDLPGEGAKALVSLVGTDSLCRACALCAALLHSVSSRLGHLPPALRQKIAGLVSSWAGFCRGGAALYSPGCRSPCPG